MTTFKPAVEGTHTKSGKKIYTVQFTIRVSNDDFQNFLKIAKKHGGYYSSYSKGGAIPGFIFSSATHAENFINESEGKEISIPTIPTKKTQKKIDLSINSGKVRKDVFRKEVEEGKLLYARHKQWNPMIDMDDHIPMSEWRWEDARELFKDDFYKKQLNSANTHWTNSISIYNGKISWDDFYFIYKDDEKETKKMLAEGVSQIEHSSEEEKISESKTTGSDSPISLQSEQTQKEKGYEVEQEHKGTLESLASGKITVDEAVHKTVEDHLKENPNYYDFLEEIPLVKSVKEISEGIFNIDFENGLTIIIDNKVNKTFYNEKEIKEQAIDAYKRVSKGYQLRPENLWNTEFYYYYEESFSSRDKIRIQILWSTPYPDNYIITAFRGEPFTGNKIQSDSLQKVLSFFNYFNDKYTIQKIKEAVDFAKKFGFQQDLKQLEQNDVPVSNETEATPKLDASHKQESDATNVFLKFTELVNSYIRGEILIKDFYSIQAIQTAPDRQNALITFEKIVDKILTKHTLEWLRIKGGAHALNKLREQIDNKAMINAWYQSFVLSDLYAGTNFNFPK